MWLDIRHGFSVLRKFDGVVSVNHRTHDAAGISAQFCQRRLHL
jgi:hypothetical protein